MFVDRVNKADLSLEGLSAPEITPAFVRSIKDEAAAVKAEYQAKYGNDWFEHFCDDDGQDTDAHPCDCEMYAVNSAILHGVRIDGGKHWVDKQEARMRELYGDRYDELKIHKPWDKRVAELLITDAVKTGKWKELPQDLWEEYWQRVRELS